MNAPAGGRLAAVRGDLAVTNRPTLVTVLACAVIAAAARLPSMGWSPGPDESGFTLVAREWSPTADSLYGTYWVDRPPGLIALIRLTDSLGGVTGIRWLAVVCCAVLVLVAAGVAVEVAASGAADATARTVVITVIGTTALVSSPWIDLVYAKSEVIALPLLVGSVWLTLRCLRTRSVISAAVAGLLAGSALSLKQNLVAAVVFAAVMLVGARGVRRRPSLPGQVRLGGAFVGGALLPWVLTVVWALAAGVRLPVLWYAVFGFRSDALSVLLDGPLAGSLENGFDLMTGAFASGLVLLLLWFTLSLRRLGRERPVLTFAALAVLIVDVVALLLGGSYWLPYLFGLVPSAVLALALLASGTPATEHRPARSRVVTATITALLAAGWVLSTADWVRDSTSVTQPSTAFRIGRGIAAVALPGDTLTVLGGRADVQLASGLPSPYEHLWSLPARTLDPRAQQLSVLMRGEQAPTWFLIWADPGAWGGHASKVVPVLASRYVKVATTCGGRPLYRLREATRVRPTVTCRDLGAG